MKANQYHSHPAAAAVAATIVTTALAASLVESFQPAQLLRFGDRATANQIVALDHRADAARERF